jgi:MYXO-CTERM domain-containing protein
MLWLTDSDDYEFSEDDVEIPEDTIFTMAAVFNKNDNKIYLGEYDAETGNYESEYGSNVYIGGVYALDTTVMKNRQQVPEPTTATLSLLALAALAARRRRR